MIYLCERGVFMNFLVEYCTGLAPVISIVKSIINLIKWGVPILLIIFGMLDLGKAVMAGKEDEMKKAQGTLIKRFIYAVAVFLVVTLVTFVMNIVADSGAGTGTQSWLDCWGDSSTSGDEAEG